MSPYFQLMFHKILVIKLFLLFLGMSLHNGPHPPSTVDLENKIVPSSIVEEAKEAFSFYPSLRDVSIEIKFKERIQKSFMQAQPKISSILNPGEKRKYVILINKAFTIEGEVFDIEQIPSEVMVGWIGHELGHIMDYQTRSSLDMIWFGIKYLSFPSFIKEAERVADTYAVEHGMAEYIIKTKDFILENASLSNAYKAKIERFYLSPEEIMGLVDELDERH